jgi:glycosyltransferase involved in cell wall biosynthesis
LCVIPPGIDSVPGRAAVDVQLAARSQLQLPELGRCVLFVGNDFRKKGLPTLIQVLRKLPADTYLAVAGDSAQMTDMRKLVVSAGLESRVYFVGALQQINTAYVAADILVHPTLEDTYAMVVLEAMAHGLPVVVSSAHYCGIASELQHEENAMIVQNPQNVDEVAKMCNLLLSDSSLYQKLSNQSIAFAQRSSWSQVAKVHAGIYQQVRLVKQ